VTRSESKSKIAESAGFFIGIGFLITAACIWGLGPSLNIPLIKEPPVSANQIVPGAWRVALRDPPMINIGTLNQRCSDCHLLFQSTRDPSRPLVQHTDIVLEHGINDQCLNCHDKADREKLAIGDEKVTGFDHVELLCAKCHGPIYRDWINGTHGKTVGYWNADWGQPVKLVCTQCHDPHHPAYRPIKPLPGPNTLRMGDQSEDHNGKEINKRNPLQRWRLLNEQAPTKGEQREDD